MLNRPGRRAGWLGAPDAVSASDIDSSSDNPFIRYRKFLWSHRQAAEKGYSDAEFIQLVQRLDSAVAELAGKGFEVTPLSALPALAQEVGIDSLAVKDEAHNVAGSHKARHLFGLALHLEVGQVPASQSLAIASCGNAALGAAVVARAAQRPLEVFAPVHADAAILDELDRLQANVHLCERQSGEAGDPSFLRFKEALEAGAMAFSVQGTENIFTLDGGRCLGWELAEALSGEDGAASDRTGGSADSLFIQVGGGALASSVIQGLAEACDLGLLRSLPRLFAVQTAGCYPLARALKLLLKKAQTDGKKAQTDGLRAALLDAEDRPNLYMWPWESEPKSIATGILDDETYDWLPVIWGILESAGGAPVVSEAILKQASVLATQHSGYEVGPTGAAGLAGAISVASSDNGPEDANSVLLGGEPLSRVMVLLTGRT